MKVIIIPGFVGSTSNTKYKKEKRWITYFVNLTPHPPCLYI